MTDTKTSNITIKISHNDLKGQTKETKKDESQVSYEVTFDAKDLSSEFEEKYNEVAGSIKVQGFRPGKVPVNYVKSRYQNEVTKEILEKVITQSTSKIIKENNLRVAMQPQIDLQKSSPEEGISFKINIDLLPEVNVPDFTKMDIEKLKYEVDEKDIDEALDRFANNAKNLKEADSKTKAKKGDTVDIDFEGKIDGELFAGGASKGHKLELGSKSFIDNFEDQLVGLKAGDEKNVKVSFPKDYHSKEHAGKEAEFAVKVNKILNAEKPEINDDLAKKYGFKDLNELKDKIKEQITSDYDKVVESKLRTQLFDLLDKECKFNAPKAMVENEYNILWNRAQEMRKQNPNFTKKSDEELQKEYRTIADRRVRLGILLADIGEKNSIKIEHKELIEAAIEQARSYPGQEQEIINYYQKNPSALESLRGPILEDKVVKMILDQVQTKDKKVSTKELLKLASSDEE